MYGLNVTWELKPGVRQEFLDKLAQTGVQQAVRNEEGCLQYDLFLPVDKADTLLLVEKWTSREAQQVHMTQPHMDTLKAVKGDYVTSTVLETYDL